MKGARGRWIPIILVWVFCVFLASCANNSDTAGGAGQTGNALSVVALDVAGVPLAGAWVRISVGEGWAGDYTVTDSGRTDERGVFIGELPDREFSIDVATVIEGESLGVFVRAAYAQDPMEQVLTLGRLGGLEGQVGAAMDSAERDQVCLLGTPRCTEVSPAGTFRFGDLAPGEYSVLLVPRGASSPTQSETQRVHPGLNSTIVLGWRVVWEDDFSGPVLDRAMWNVEVGNGCPDLCGWGNGYLQTFVDDPAVLSSENSALRLRGIRALDSAGEWSYSAAKISSAALQWQYGFMEVRARMPDVQGAWAILSMRPAYEGAATWPESGSLDIASVPGHWRGETRAMVHQVMDSVYEYATGIHPTAGLLSEEYHTYALQWDADSLRFYFDGVAFFTEPTTETFRHPFHLVIELAVGGASNLEPEAVGEFAPELWIESVRMRQQ